MAQEGGISPALIVLGVLLLPIVIYVLKQIYNRIIQWSNFAVVILAATTFAGLTVLCCSPWVHNNSNLKLVLLLAFAYIVSLIDVYSLLGLNKNKLDKIFGAVTITTVFSIMAVVPVMFIGYLINLLLLGNNNPKGIEALCYGWCLVAVVCFIFRIPYIINFDMMSIHKKYLKGDELYRQEKYSEAIDIYEEAAEESFKLNLSLYLYGYYAIGMAYIGLNEFNKANDYFEKVMENPSSNTKLLYAVADGYIEIGNWDNVFLTLQNLSERVDKNSSEYKKCEELQQRYTEQQSQIEKERKEKRAEDLYQRSINYKNDEKYIEAQNLVKKAINLVPENEKYGNLLNEIQQLLDAEKGKAEELYNQALNLKNEGQYNQAANVLKNAYEFAHQFGVDTSHYDKLDSEIEQELKRLKKAENLYKKGRNYADSLKFAKALEVLKEAVNLVSDNEDYNKLLSEVRNLYEEEKTRFHNLYNEAVNLKYERNYEKALEIIEEAYKIAELQGIPTSDVDYLNSEITSLYTNNKKANELYNQSIDFRNNGEYGKALEKIKEANELVSDNEEFGVALSEIKSLYEDEERRFYEICSKSEMLKNNGDYQQALDNLGEAFEVAEKQGFSDSKPNNLKNEINEILQNIKRAEEFYQIGIDYKNDSQFGDAIESLNSALNIFPDDVEYRDLLNEVVQLYEAEKEKMENLLQKANNLKANDKFQEALDLIDEIYNIADKQHFSAEEIDRLNTELTGIFENNKIAEENYNNAQSLFNSKQYKDAVSCLEKACELVPKNTKYERKLKEIRQAWDEIKKNANDLYNEAERYFEEDNIEQALTSINSAIELVQIKKYTKLKEEIECRQREIEDKKKADDLYNKALADFEQKYYANALSAISEAILLCPNNKTYRELKLQITKEQRRHEDEEKARALYESGIKALNDADFTKAVENLEKACRLIPDNEEWSGYLEKARSGKIDIKTCTKQALMTLDYIDEDMADNIIESREEGMLWYDYQSFAEQFEFQPHLYMDIEERFAFPLKPTNKYGRRLDM